MVKSPYYFTIGFTVGIPEKEQSTASNFEHFYDVGDYERWVRERQNETPLPDSLRLNVIKRMGMLLAGVVVIGDAAWGMSDALVASANPNQHSIPVESLPWVVPVTAAIALAGIAVESRFEKLGTVEGEPLLTIKPKSRMKMLSESGREGVEIDMGSTRRQLFVGRNGNEEEIVINSEQTGNENLFHSSEITSTEFRMLMGGLLYYAARVSLASEVTKGFDKAVSQWVNEALSAIFKGENSAENIFWQQLENFITVKSPGRLTWHPTRGTYSLSWVSRALHELREAAVNRDSWELPSSRREAVTSIVFMPSATIRAQAVVSPELLAMEDYVGIDSFTELSFDQKLGMIEAILKGEICVYEDTTYVYINPLDKDKHNVAELRAVLLNPTEEEIRMLVRSREDEYLRHDYARRDRIRTEMERRENLLRRMLLS